MEAQCFGPDTELELEPLDVVLRRETGQWRQPQIRFWAGGDPASWDLDEWLPTSRLAYWKAQGTPVELAVPRSVLGKLSATERNRLSAWSETGLATVLEVSEEAAT